MPLTTPPPRPRAPLSRRAEAGAILGTYALLTLIVTWPLATHLAAHLPGDLTDPLFNTWVMAWNAYALRTFQNVWDAPIFFPYRDTLAYSEHLLGMSLPMAPVQWLLGNPVLVYNIVFLLSYVLAAGGMYLLVRRLTARADAALVAGCWFAFCSYRWVQHGHLQVLMWGWLPVSVWAVHEYFRTGSRRWLAAAVIAFALLGLSNAHFMFFGAVAVAIVGLYEIWMRRGLSLRVGIDALAAAAVLAAVFLPIARAYARAGLTQAWAHSTGEISLYSATLTSYLSTMPFVRMWAWLPFDAPGEVSLFPGAAALVLSLVALWPGRTDSSHRRWIRVYGAVAAAGLILSFGPRPWFWPEGWIEWPYGWLVAFVPGFSAIRVPARAAVLVFLGLGVLSGFGAARLLTPAAGRGRWALAAGLCLAIIVEGFGGPMPLTRLRLKSPASENAAYAWIREGPPGGLIELPPQGGLMAPGSSDLYYQLHTVVHGRPIVNGSSRFEPPLTRFLKGRPSPLRDVGQLPDVPRMLRSFGVRYILLRPRDYADQGVARATLQAFAASADVAEHRQFGGTANPLEVFRLHDAFEPLDRVSSAGWSLVPPSAYVAAASARPDQIALALDGDPRTRWDTGRTLAGTEQVELQFDRARHLTRLRLALGRSDGDYPRQLRISAVDPDGQSHIVYEGSILPQLAAGILADPRLTPIDVDLSPNFTRLLRIRQTGVTPQWWWSIHELAVWER